MSHPSATAPSAGRFDPRYPVVFGACITQFTIVGLVYAYGVLFPAFEAEFGWSRTQLSACVSLAFLVMGVLAMPCGRLNDRFGPKVVLTVTGTAFGLGFTLISQVSQPWHLYAIFGVLIGLGLATHDVVTLGTVARWFERRRGIMTAVVKSGTAAGQTVLPPLTAILMVTFGWRVAVIALGVASLALLVVAALSMRAPPRPAGAVVDLPEDGVGYAELRRTRVFWTLCAVQALFFPALTTVPLHIVVHGMDLGMTATFAAGLLSCQGAASVAGRFAIGALADRLPGRTTYIICFVPFVASLCALLVFDSHWLLYAVVALYGLAHGGLFTVVSPTIAEYFGMRAHGAAFGSIVFFGTIGGAIGPILAGRAYDMAGSYMPAFGTLAAMGVLGLILVLSLPRATRP